MPSSADSSVTTVARLVCDEATARRLADALAESLGDAAVAAFETAGGTSGGTSGGTWSVEAHFAAPPDEAALRDLVAAIAGEAAAHGVVIETVAARDWVAASLAGLKPVAAGRFVVHGAHDRARVAPHRIGIEIEAALAFGTGHHGTTRGCLMALDAWLKRRRPRQTPSPALPRIRLRAARYGGQARGRGKRVLDVGTGTGVLAIAAAKALRGRVLASDIDARAVATARANAHANAVGALVEVVHAGGLAARRLRAGGPFDLVLANILLAPLRRLAAPIARTLAPQAHVVISGLLAAQAPAALAAYRAQGLALRARIPRDEWVTLVLVRHGTRPRITTPRITSRAGSRRAMR
jgi:ribosomal protein L11 methyltransferase